MALLVQVKMWDETFPSPLLSFDLGTSVGDISWAPYSSTVFAAVTDEGKVNVYDLHANKHEQLCEQKIVRKARCTHVTFSSYAPLLLVGDSAGGVVSLKLSPNLRKITPIPTPIAKKGETAPAPPSREEIGAWDLASLPLRMSCCQRSAVPPLVADECPWLCVSPCRDPQDGSLAGPLGCQDHDCDAYSRPGHRQEGCGGRCCSGCSCCCRRWRRSSRCRVSWLVVAGLGSRRMHSTGVATLAFPQRDAFANSPTNCN